MLNFLRRETQEKNREETEPQSFRTGESQRLAQGDEEASVEPVFPSLAEAQEIHDQSLTDFGQPQAHLINPSGLEGALGRAANYWHYGEGSDPERMADAAGALAHGIGMSQAFEDGNKRTAYHTARYFLHNNNYGHLSPVDADDDELANHLIGHGEGTHSLEDTQGLFRSRMGQQRKAALPSPPDPENAEWEQGLCDAYAIALARANPKLRVGTYGVKFDDGGWWAGEHTFAHDDTHLYDIRGKRPLQPYLDDPMREVDLGHTPDSYQEAYGLNGSLQDVERAEEIVPRLSNILDPIHDTLDARMFDNPATPEPILKPEHSKFIHQKIFETLENHGYDGMERWLSLVLTGSLTTYQYSETSDCDVSLFVDTANFPEWSRAEMIGIMVGNCDGTLVPGTPFPLQCFVVARHIRKEDLYKPGLRSGYDLATDTWIVPPDKSRVHDVEHEMNLAYTQGLEAADKMDRLLRYEPLQAIRYWHTIHKKRQRDMKNGLGDYATSNVIYKTLANRGMFDQIAELTGEHIAKVSHYEHQLAPIAEAYNAAPMYDPQAHSAWEELAAQSKQQADQVRNRYNVSITDDPEPYANAHEMFADLNRGNFVVSQANSEHPIWTPEQNVNFRIAHDVLGHLPSGGDFSWEGENKACAAHSPQLSPAAQRALFTECIAQTAYANHYGGFGPQKTAFLDQTPGLQVPQQELVTAAEGDGTLCHRHIRVHGRTH